MKPSDLPSLETIAKLCRVAPKRKKTRLGKLKSKRECMRRKRAKLIAAGLTSEGKPRINTMRPELSRYRDRNEYQQRWRKAVGGKTKKK